MPPTERKGRVHTSTVTVAVINPSIKKIEFNESDLRIDWFSGSGAGGQNRNKVKNCCKLTHAPTGITASAQTRDRTNSYKLARAEIEQRVKQQQTSAAYTEISAIRKDQVGSGMRGDKVRTIRFQDNTIVDHRTEKKMKADKFMKGFMDELWN